jgi:hypothetical protein
MNPARDIPFVGDGILDSNRRTGNSPLHVIKFIDAFVKLEGHAGEFIDIAEDAATLGEVVPMPMTGTFVMLGDAYHRIPVEAWRGLDGLNGTETFAHRNALGRQLEAAASEAEVQGWDGYDGAPMAARAYENALRFIANYPSDIKVPDVLPLPDGSVGFEWSDGERNIVALSLLPDDSIAFASNVLDGRGGIKRVGGDGRFSGLLPTEVADVIRRYLGD